MKRSQDMPSKGKLIGNKNNLVECMSSVDELSVNAELRQIENLRSEILIQRPIAPPEYIWEKINVTRKLDSSVIQLKRSRFSTLIKIAASIPFFLMGWLIWSNYSMQTKLEEVLQVNRLLESQLMQDEIPTFRQTQLLLKIRLIELELKEVKTVSQKLALLQEREKIMQVMVYKKQGKNYEYSI